jgi:hypothetical protein
MQDLCDDLIGRLVGVIARTASSAFQPLVTEFPISVSPFVLPFIERRSCDPEVAECLVDVSDSLRVYENPLLAVDFSLIVGYSGVLGHHPGG